MSEEDTRYPHESALNKGKHKMDGLLRGLDLNNVVIEKRSRNNSESSHSVSGEAASKKKSNTTLSDTSKITKHRKSSNEIYLAKVIEEQEDSQEDNRKANQQKDLKEVKVKNSTEDLNSQRRKLRSSGIEKQDEISNIKSKKHQKINAKVTQHTEKIMNQKVQQEQSTFNLNNSNEEGLSSTSCSSDLLKKTRNKSNYEVEVLSSHKNPIHVLGSTLKIEKQVEKKRKTSDSQKVEPSAEQSKVVSKEKQKSSQNKKEEAQFQSQKQMLDKGNVFGQENFRKSTRSNSLSSESIRKHSSEDNTNSLKKQAHKKKDLSSTPLKSQSQRDLRASKREIFKNQELQELQQLEKISSEQKQIKQTDQLKTLKKQDNNKENLASKIENQKYNSNEHTIKKQVTFKEKLSEIIGEEAESAPVKGSFNNAYDYNVHQDSDSEKDYFPSKKALKNHKKEKRIKKRQENKLEIAIKKTQKLLKTKSMQMRQQRTIISVEIPSESSFEDDEDEETAGQNHKTNHLKNQKVAFFSKKLNDLDKTNSYKSKREKVIQENCSSLQIQEGKKSQQILEISDNRNGKNKSNDVMLTSLQQKNIKSLSLEASGQKNLNSNLQINSQGVENEAQTQNGKIIQKNQNAYGKNKNSESKSGNNSLEIQSQKKNLQIQQIHSTNQQVKAEIEFKDKQIKKKQSFTTNLQNQMNLKDKQFQNTNNFNSEIGITQRENNSDQNETDLNLEQKNLKRLNNFNTPLEGYPTNICSSSSLLIIEEDKLVKDVNNDPHTLSQDQANQFTNQQESSKTQLIPKCAHQDGQQKLQNEENFQQQEEDYQDNFASNSQQIRSAEQDITGQVEVNQTQQKNIFSQQRQIQNENRKRDVSSPFFYDPKIEFINTNIFFKNFYTEFQPQNRKTFYQKVAYQHHLQTYSLTQQHTPSQQTQSIVQQSQKPESNNQIQVVSQQNEQQKEEQLLQAEIQDEEKLLKEQLSIEQNYQNHSNQLISIGQNDNFIEKNICQENSQDLNQTNSKVQKDITSNEMQIEKQALSQQAQSNLQNAQDEQNQELKKKHIGILADKNKESGENMVQLQSELDLLYEKYYPSQTYINCDLKYFNLELIIQNTGLFDIVYMDPPWRIKGGQQFDSQFMFSNSKFSLDYDTMSNKEIMDIPVERLSNKGFLFLWILNTQMNTAIQMMQKWGYNLVDKIVWVKMKDKNVYLSHGYYFMHSFELCLIGYKNDTKDDLTSIYPASNPFSVIDENILEENKSKGGNKKSEINLEYPHFFNKISNNVIFAEVRKKSQKPDEIYEIIDLLIPGAKKIELFARNNNLRPGWVSVGNQLGETYEKWMHQVNCDNCHQEIVKGKLKRYKSRRINNYDICENCVLNFDKKDFYEIQNKVNEDILHNYQSCNRCEAEPIWGIRFHCMICKDFDLCEACVDENTKLCEEEQFHNLQHDMKIIEVPVFADGFPVHDRKCQSCFMSPIIGTCFTCKQCQGNFNLCQNCYFSKPIETIKNKRHRPEHQMDALISPVKNTKTKKIQFKCAGCGVLNLKDMYKCENCYGFYFCLSCYETKCDDFKTYMASSHKNYHSLIRYNLEEIESQNEQKVELQDAQAQQINNDPINSQLILNVISQILDTDEVNKPQNIDNYAEEGRQDQLKELNQKQIDEDEDNILKNKTEIQEESRNINQDTKNKKNGQTKRPYNRKQKVKSIEDKDETNLDKQNNNQVELQNDKQNEQLNIEQDQSGNQNMNQLKEDQDELEKAEEQNLKSNLVKKIRKKRVSKKQKQQLEDQSEEKKEENNDQLIDKKSDSINNENKSVDESKQNQMEEEEDQKEESNKNEDDKEENEIQEENKVVKKRKRRTKEEIEKFKQEKEQKNLEYLIGLQDGKEKKKRGRLPKLKDNSKLQVLLNSQIEQNQQQKQSDENSFLQINQSNINEQFFDKQHNEYNQKLIQDQLLLETLSNQPSQIVTELQYKLKLLESYQQQKVVSENENTKLNNSNNDIYFLSDINQASDSKENTLHFQIQNQLNKNKISNFNYSNQEDQQIQNPFDYDLLQNLLNSINRNSLQQSNHSYNEENTIQYNNNSVEKIIQDVKENQQKENLIGQVNQEQINQEDQNDDESYDSSSSSS
ncbi:MT-A70 family protein (macronuclear) [Tetrahymena thermophila SB210]|uniref:MT-A70 family protein n=1 Tax=Tetrahymena thermophila (strain SB210) TaxID=312017 RepID=Q23RE0_TETTS|nr:MT-A70 family protein [Tetrahymena thermophila SB210]EAR99108.2 MT-A70 family protein [Tetrahymena thermophila SB210]|eukprot:XP_001019353.2 MT-A70 family protein [Tetrahymena thermophila SB210]